MLVTTSIGEAVRDVRSAIPAASRDRSSAKGAAYFAVAATVYLSTFAAIGLVQSWTGRIAIALVNGLTIGIIFIVGHDACHGSLTPRRGLNKWLGRLAFLPSLHPFAAWEYSHNAMHHGWTNLRYRDPVYCPLTREEFAALSRWQQCVERLYRSWLGLLPLYLTTIWWRLEISPNAHHRAQIDKRGTFVFDRALVAVFPVAQVALLLSIATTAGGASLVAASWVAALGAVVPFLTFNWLIGFATFQHHTHPRVVWYDNEAEWSFFRSQVQGTVHIVFPRWIELALHNIMEHTAHHVDVRVPLYGLTSAQRAIEEAFGPENVISEAFSFRGMKRTFQSCQLYDYQRHCWLSFDGRPTTAPRSLEREAGARDELTPR